MKSNERGSEVYDIAIWPSDDLAESQNVATRTFRRTEFCERFGIDRTKMYEGIAAGRFKAIEVGMVSARDLEWLNAHRGDDSWRMGRIRGLLIAATGQTPGVRQVYLREIATMVREGAAPPGWREMVEKQYPHLIESLDWVSRHDIDGNPLQEVQNDRNPALTEEQRKLVTDHLPLVRKYAVQRASRSTPQAAKVSTAVASMSLSASGWKSSNSKSGGGTRLVV
jgi:hypothetical protein